MLKVRGVLRSGSEEKHSDVNWSKVNAAILKAMQSPAGKQALIYALLCLEASAGSGHPNPCTNTCAQTVEERHRS